MEFLVALLVVGLGWFVWSKIKKSKNKSTGTGVGGGGKSDVTKKQE